VVHAERNDGQLNDQREILKTILHTLEDKHVPQQEVSSNRKGNFPLNANTRKLIRHKKLTMDKIHID